MARKSRYASPVQVFPEEADISRAALYKRISVEDGDDEKQNSLGTQQKIGKCLST